jgi:hypothetical protein
MAGSETWAGWIRFSGILILIIAMIDFFEGLTALIRGSYYAVTPDQIIVFDLTTWGWLTLLWSLVLAVVGFALLAGATWARWTAIVIVSLNFLLQLGFVGSAQYPLWALTMMALNILVLYTLIVRWDEGAETLRRQAETRFGAQQWRRPPTRERVRNEGAALPRSSYAAPELAPRKAPRASTRPVVLPFDPSSSHRKCERCEQ